MAILFLLGFAAFLFFGTGILYFMTRLFGLLWVALEVFLNGLVGGTHLFLQLFWWCVRVLATVTFLTWCVYCKVGLALAQYAYAVAYSYGGYLKRGLIALHVRMHRAQ